MKAQYSFAMITRRHQAVLRIFLVADKNKNHPY